MERLQRLFAAHRQRLARLFALFGVLVIAFVLVPQVPRPLDVELLLPEGHDEFIEVRLAYLEAGEELQGARLAFPEGAPSRVRHTAKLPAGDVEVRAVALRSDGRTLSRSAHIHAPSDGPLVIRLAEAAP